MTCHPSPLWNDGAVSTASPTHADPTVAPDLTPDEITLSDTPWVTIVWNDPVNLMSYVTFVFTKYFGYSKKKAEKLMLEVHEDGRSVVSTGSREEMERDVQAMHEYGLWATLQKADA
ncbi:ATP-dependent Clp protease adapter ClpS [Nocardioides ultimimeridianus]